MGATSSVVPVMKSSDAGFSGFSLDQTDSIAKSNKRIKKLLEDCNSEYSFLVNEIRDVDSILHTDVQLYPATAYSFAISVECWPSGGYEWVANETKRNEVNLDQIKTRIMKLSLRNRRQKEEENTLSDMVNRRIIHAD